MSCTTVHLWFRSLNIVSLSDMIEGSYRSWDLYTTGQLVDGLQQKKKPVFIKRKWNYVLFSRATILSFHTVIVPKTWRGKDSQWNTSQIDIRTDENLCAYLGGWAPKRGHAPDANLWRQTQQRNPLENKKIQKENARYVSALSLSPQYIVSLCPAYAVDSTFILSFFLPVTTYK